MKKYNQFINENNSNEFKVAINIKNISDDDLYNLNEIFKKYFDVYEIINKYSSSNKPHTLVLDVSYKNLYPWCITTPDWGHNEDYIINIINPSELINAKLNGIKDIVDYFEARQNTKKFNL